MMEIRAGLLRSVIVLGILSVSSAAAAQVFVSIGDAFVTEGDSAAEGVLVEFPLTLSGDLPTTKDVTVRYSTASGTALTNVDFQFVNNALITIPAGSSSGVASVQVIEDLAVEPDETFTVNLSSPTNALLGAGVATGTILDDDSDGAPVPALGLAGRLLLAFLLLVLLPRSTTRRR